MIHTELIIGKRKIGSFVNIWHDIGGEVFALDDETILIEDFTYDGQVKDGVKMWRVVIVAISGPGCIFPGRHKWKAVREWTGAVINIQHCYTDV